MTFQTKRTVLCAYQSDDAETLLEHWNSLEIQDLAFISCAAPRTKKFVEQAAEHFQKDEGLLAIATDKTNGAFVGQISLSMLQRKNRIGEIGISLDEAYRGKAYGTELLTWLVQHGFRNCNLHRIQLGTVENNLAARALYKKVGFTEEGISRKSNWIGGKWLGMVRYSILEDEWDVETGRKQEVTLD